MLPASRMRDQPAPEHLKSHSGSVQELPVRRVSESQPTTRMGGGDTSILSRSPDFPGIGSGGSAYPVLPQRFSHKGGRDPSL